MSDAGAEQQQLQALANMLLLQQRLREAQNVPELGFILANDTQSLLSYRAGMVWTFSSQDGSQGSITSVSGAVDHDPHSPYLQWAKEVAIFAADELGAKQGHLQKPDLPENLAPDWDRHGTAFLEWLPLRSAAGVLLGG